MWNGFRGVTNNSLINVDIRQTTCHTIKTIINLMTKMSKNVVKGFTVTDLKIKNETKV